MPSDKEIEERARRRDKAVEENKNMLLLTIKNKEKLLANVYDIKNVLEGLTVLRDNLDYHLDMAMNSDTANNINEEFVSKILIALREQVSKLNEIDVFLSSAAFSLAGALERMSVILEINSKDTNE